MIDPRSTIRARWLGGCFVAVAALLSVLTQPGIDPRGLLAVLAAVAIYNAMAAWKLSRREPGPRFYATTFFLDLVALAALLAFCGDLRWPLSVACMLPVVGGVICSGRRLGVMLASLALVLMGALAVRDVLVARNPAGLVHLVVLAGLLCATVYGVAAIRKRISDRTRPLVRDNERLTLLLDNVPAGVVLLGADGVMSCNAEAERLVKKLGGRSIHTLHGQLGVMERVATLRTPLEEFETVHDGRQFAHRLARSSPAQDAPIVWVCKDITEERKLMAQLAHRSKMADLGLMAAGIAHEIGNPLASMSAIIELLVLTKADNYVRYRLTSLSALVDRVSRIVTGVTDFARPTQGLRGRHSIHSLVHRALGIFTLNGKSRGVSVDVLPGLDVSIDGVDDQLVQVFLNLLLNAVDASDGAGTITVAPAHRNGEVGVTFIDTGSGIAEDVRRHLFTPFFTTKEPGKGLGLGLFVSESIVRLHGGHIDVDSAPGRGSAFTVWLPHRIEAEAEVTRPGGDDRSEPAASIRRGPAASGHDRQATPRRGA